MKAYSIARRKLLASAMSIPLALAIPAIAVADEGVTGATPSASGGYIVLSGSSLKSTLEGWTRAAGWTLIWDSEVDYRLRASANFDRNFVNAATRLIDSIHVDHPELVATFYRGNNVLQIKSNNLSSK